MFFLSFIFLLLLTTISGVGATQAPTTGYMVKNITVEGGTFTTEFKPQNTIYSVYFDNFVDTAKVSVELTNPRFEYKVKGQEWLLREEENVITIYATDPQGVYPDETYTLNILFDTVGLTYLDVENGIFSPQFDKFHIVYYAIVENNVDTYEKAAVNYRTVNANAKVKVECLDELNTDGTLKEGRRTEYKLTVIETDKTTKDYRLRIYRKSLINPTLDDNALLQNLVVNNGTAKLTQSFNPKRANYDVIVPASVENLDVQAHPQDKTNLVEVIGSTAMQQDRPTIITVKVSSDVYDTESYYTLRCQYNTVMHTDKHTDLQLYAYILCALIIGGLIGALISNIIKRKTTGRIEHIEYQERHLARK